MLDVILKRFEHPDEVRTFEKGRFELIGLGGMTIGRGYLSTGMEVVECMLGARRRCIALQCRARWAGCLRLRHGSDG